MGRHYCPQAQRSKERKPSYRSLVERQRHGKGVLDRSHSKAGSHGRHKQLSTSLISPSSQKARMTQSVKVSLPESQRKADNESGDNKLHFNDNPSEKK